MKYITSVITPMGTKHIVEVNGVNHEALHSLKREEYSDKKGASFIQYSRVKVFEDFKFIVTGSNAAHLAEVLMAIEIVRFITQSAEVDFA